MEQDALRFERASPGDAWILAEISERAFHSDIHCGAPGLGGPPGYKSDRWQTRMMMAGDYYKMLFYDRTVGGVIVRLQGYQCFNVVRIFVDPAFQNQGIGTRAFEFLWTEYPEVQLWTLGTPAWNRRTRHFYGKLGFVETGSDGRGGIILEKRCTAPSSRGASRSAPTTAS